MEDTLTQVEHGERDTLISKQNDKNRRLTENEHNRLIELNMKLFKAVGPIFKNPEY